MNRRTILCAALLMNGCMIAAQAAVAQSNPPCGGKSATAFVNWPQFHFDACHTGYNPNEFILGPSNVGNLVVAWQFPGGANQIYNQPTLANGILYIGSNDHNLYAINAMSGAMVWKYQLNSPVSSTPVIANGVVFISSAADMYALNARDATLLWKYTADAPFVSDAVVVDGVVYFGDDGVYALNANTGALLWKTGTTYMLSPAVTNGVVYASAGGEGSVYALDANTGAQLWKSAHYWSNVPVVANGIVYLVSGAYGLGAVALRADTGTLLWQLPTVFENFNSPAVAYGKVYFASSDSYLYALDAYTGKLQWKHFESPFNYPSPAVANGVVYALSNYGHLIAVDAFTGDLLWEHTGLFSDAPLIEANGMIFVGSDYGRFSAFHLPGR